MLRRPSAAVLLAGMLALAGCSGGESGPYLAMNGGGFIFNYRIAEATAGFVVGVLRKLPEGAAVEATFQNPEGGEAIVLRQYPSGTDKRLDFVTPPLHGIKVDTDYLVTLRLVGADGKELQRIEKNFRSNVDQSVLPDKPLTVGPGYMPNPDGPPPTP